MLGSHKTKPRMIEGLPMAAFVTTCAPMEWPTPITSLIPSFLMTSSTSGTNESQL